LASPGTLNVVAIKPQPTVGPSNILTMTIN
jgi:hypothetical protein